ncbi:hypothetical protein [Pseudomonas fluorescens]|uniref:hypothetical protein n=1 Tax=Pseudomonas fluorescens TaxID=294 RepID=UPI00124092DF|nr:hypothetical protein [Pseudomonas fluorescens]VVN44894.1 hypothetical protein PS639_05657 [Pseudomonas fluorescens]
MTYDVNLDQYALQCEVTELLDVLPAPWATSRDWDAYGYRELEFRVVSAQVSDENGDATELGRNGCAALAGQYRELIEEEMRRQIEAAKREAAA